MKEHIKKIQASATCLYSQTEVEQAIDQLAEKISLDISEKDPIIVSVLNGGLIVTGALLLRFDFPLRCDYLHATRYDGKTEGGQLTWIKCPSLDFKDQVILIVDDILDEGITLKTVVDACQAAGAKQVLTAVLLEKKHDRGNGMTADYVGLLVEDKYVFGYGLDYKGYLRNATGIFSVDEQGFEEK